MGTEKTSASLLINLLALAGCVIVLGILIWGLTHLTTVSASWFFSFFNRTPTQEQVVETETSSVLEMETTSAPTPTPAGPPDLEVGILRAGTTNAYETFVVFDIANRGHTPTGVWYFSANVPTAGQSQLYISPTQISLVPGAHIENTLRFSQSIAGTFTVSVDPENRVKEANESNNTASQYVSYTPAPISSYGY